MTATCEGLPSKKIMLDKRVVSRLLYM